MSQITTHILDTSIGKPAPDVAVTLLFDEDEGWRQIAADRTDQDGRLGDWLGGISLHPGTYKLHFAVAEYFERRVSEAFYPYVEIVFTVAAEGQHYHVPLLLSPYGYSTYRGS
ncbi:MAG: hydroxyisourate hydrolase [bacterium]